MNIMAWLLTGCIAAIAISLRMHELQRQRLLVDTVFGGLGGLLAGAVAVPVERWLSFDTDLQGLAAAAVGTAAALTIAHLRV